MSAKKSKIPEGIPEKSDTSPPIWMQEFMDDIRQQMDRQMDDQKAFREEMRTFMTEIKNDLTEQIENLRRDTLSMFQFFEDNHVDQRKKEKV